MRAVPEEEIRKRLAADNPWWEETAGAPAPYQGLRPRPYLDLFLPLVENREVRRAVVLMGPRRVGKTVLLHHAIGKLLAAGTPPRRLCYLSVDLPLYNGLGLEELLEHYAQASGTDPKSKPCFVFFDEIQYLKGWEVHLKAIVDRYPLVKCVASGSAAAALRLKSNESGAGRFTDFLLPPLTFYEFLLLVGDEELVRMEGEDSWPTTADLDRVNSRFFEYLSYGGYPEAATSRTIQDDLGRYVKSDIVDKVLLRDLPSLYGIQDIQELNSLFTTLAFNTGGEVSLEELSKSSGVAKNTIKRYLEYLEATFLIRRVERIDRNARRFKRANFFKVYLTNPSIRSALFSPVGPDDREAPALVETAIFAQWFHREERIHYARWPQGEVDLVRLDGLLRPTWAVEVKWTDRALDRPGELAALIQFCQANQLRKAYVTTRGREGLRTVRGVELELRPASLYAYAVGYRGLRLKLGQPEPERPLP